MGKYFPRSAIFNSAQHFYVSQFYSTIKRNGGKVPAYLPYEVE